MSTNGSQLPEHLEKIRTRVQLTYKKIHNPNGNYAARAFASSGFDNTLKLDNFRREVNIKISSVSEEEVTFDIENVDAPICNALRRILLSEVPTIAIETVDFHDNTSIIHDESLAHRLGLIPLRIDPRPFQIRKKGDAVNYLNTIKFRLEVRCDLNSNAPNDVEAPPDVLYRNSKVLSSDIEYVPFPGSEQDQLTLLENIKPAPVHDDILLAKLRPGQKIHVEMDATKNIGQEHAKWSPVCPVAYRMAPVITLKKEIVGEEAQALVNKCPAKVFDIEDERVVVARPRDCTMCRECVREPDWEEKVELERKRDHFIFGVESSGALPAPTLVTEAFSVLSSKCDELLAALDMATKQYGGPVDDEMDDAYDIDVGQIG